jgi:transposase InsO family protein
VDFVTKELGKWLARVGAKTPYIEPRSSWENGYCETFKVHLLVPL